MSKTEQGSKLVFPTSDEVSVVKGYLKGAGFSEADQAWLVRVFQQPDCFGNPDGSGFKDDFDDFETGLQTVLKALKALVPVEEDRQTNLALLFSKMLDFGPGSDTWFLPNIQLKESKDTPKWVGEFQRHAEFSKEIPNVDKLLEIRDSVNAVFYFDELLPFIFPEGVPLNQVVNLGLLNPIQRRSWSSNDFRDPRELEFWLKWRFHANTERCNIIRLQTLLPDFADVPETDLGDKILGLCNAISYGMHSASTLATERLDALNEGWRVVAHELLPFLELLSAKRPELIQERSSLLKAWWQLAKTIYGWSMGGLESELSDELRNRLIESASRHIGILRSILRDEPEIFEAEDSSGSPVHDFYSKAFYALLALAPPWRRLKPLLLAFSEMQKQAVTSDLRAWYEYGQEEPIPDSYSEVPRWIAISMYPQNLRDELERDPSLQELREEFSKFCLSRLRTRRKKDEGGYADADFVEPRVPWRRCYVQAAAALRVNPGGRGHQTLFWLSQNDPDERVREFAKKAHKQIRQLDRRKSNLDEGASPRRPLFEAFWWLRQAHLSTLGIEIDKGGALRTRRKELHRTREKDDRFR